MFYKEIYIYARSGARENCLWQHFASGTRNFRLGNCDFISNESLLRYFPNFSSLLQGKSFCSVTNVNFTSINTNYYIRFLKITSVPVVDEWNFVYIVNHFIRELEQLKKCFVFKLQQIASRKLL